MVLEQLSRVNLRLPNVRVVHHPLVFFRDGDVRHRDSVLLLHIVWEKRYMSSLFRASSKVMSGMTTRVKES